jgi:hypothetical protein
MTEANFADGVHDDLLPGSEQCLKVERVSKHCVKLVHSCIRHIVPGCDKTMSEMSAVNRLFRSCEGKKDMPVGDMEC